jgi:elongation of very long chain fatty acids protein 6
MDKVENFLHTIQPTFEMPHREYTQTAYMTRGMEYQQLPHLYPALSPLYSDFEKTYDPEPLLMRMKYNNYIVPSVAIVLYLAFCYFGQKIMARQTAFGLNGVLAGWNLFLSLFSFWGAIRMVPHTLWLLRSHSFEETICEPAYLSYGSGAAGFAVQMFCLSKIPELIDTVFIVLRKKPLIFLHWYHHVTVLAFCWNSYVTESGAGHYFASMNYTVHAVMYFYYYLQAIKAVPKNFPSWIITILQISQMIAGTGIVCASIYYYRYGGKKYAPGECNNNESNLIAGGIIYASYLYLFVEFAVKRFIFGVKDEPKRVKKSN